MSRPPVAQKLRAILFNLVFFGGTGLMAIFGLPFAVTPWRWSMGLGRTWSRWSLAWLRWIVGLDHEVRGWDNLPPGPCLIAMKHQSAWDTLIMPVLLGDPAVVIKRELKRVPFYGWYASRAGSIFVDRKGGAAALKDMVAQARTQVARNRKIVIFPQGTRTAPGEHGPAYQPGVAALYQALGLPLVPAAVNSGLFWGRRAFNKRPGRIILEFLPPIPPGQPRRAMMAEMESRIEEATTRLVAEGS